MYIFWGILSALITAVLEFVMLKMPYSIHIQMLGMVFPIGGILDGGLSAIGIFIYLKIKHIRLRPRHCISGILIAFLSFWSIYFINYASAYVYNGSINYNFKGEHISSYEDKYGKKFTFDNYLKFRIRNISFKSTWAGGLLSETNNFGNSFNTFVFISECLGFCLGGFIISGIALEDRGTCRKCKNPFTVRRLYIFKPEYLNDEMEGLKGSLLTREKFEDYVYKARESLTDEEPYVEVSLKYCNNCSKGYIVFSRIVPRIKAGKRLVWVEDKDTYRQIELDSDRLKIVD